MATASDRRDSSVRPPGSIYPWEKWQDGQWWTITKGADFNCPVQSMRNQLHVRAKTTGVRVKTHTDKEAQVTFTFQKKSETDEQFEDRISTVSR